jgi:hypothetical protein
MALVAIAWVADYVPEQTLQQLMAKHKLDETGMKLMAGSGLLTCDMLAAAGDNSNEFMANLKMLTPTWSLWVDEEPTRAARTLVQIKLKSIWKDACLVQTAQSAAQAKVAEDPSKVPTIEVTTWQEMRTKFIEAHGELRFDGMCEPRRRFVEVLKRDFMLHGRVLQYEVTRMWVRNDGMLTSTSAVAKNADDLIKLVKQDSEVAVKTEENILDRLTCFMYALEFVGHWKLSMTNGLLYLQEFASGIRSIQEQSCSSGLITSSEEKWRSGSVTLAATSEWSSPECRWKGGTSGAKRSWR